MTRLHNWLWRQLDEKLMEPNSALGEASRYMLKHWEKLTRFLQVPGAPLDNNICERALKKAILHRKIALFYKTQRGAQIGDLYMSLIYTCSHLRTVRRQPLRLPDCLASKRGARGRGTRQLATLELPGNSGARRSSRRRLLTGPTG